MKRLIMTALAGAALALGASTAHAQGIGFGFQRPPTSPVNHPPVNPILNSLGRGQGGVGYYTLTRPQVDANRAINQLQYGLQGLQQGQGATAAVPPGTPTVGQTGHLTTFFNYSHYYTYPAPRFGPGSTAGGTPQAPAGFGQAPSGPAIGIVLSVPIRSGD